MLGTTVWLCGQKYERCQSTLFAGGTQCADKIGHDGLHNSTWQYWSTVEQDDQPTGCDCFRVPHAFYCATITADLVPGYPATADGLADAADQRKADQR